MNLTDEVEITKLIIESGAISIREEPFLYSSGNRGPGYVSIKGLVGQPSVMKKLCKLLAIKIDNIVYKTAKAKIDVVNGNVTGGVIPGWEICNALSEIQQREIPYVYLRVNRKQGGHNELITGDENNKLIDKSKSKCNDVLIVEELVNYAETTCNAATTFRDNGYSVNWAACILSYDHQLTRDRLKTNGVLLISLITLPRLLTVAKEHNLLDKSLVNSYLKFLSNPTRWQIKRGLALPLTETQISELINNKYDVKKLELEEAIQLGAPVSHLEYGVQYYHCVSTRPQALIYVALDFDDAQQIKDTVHKLSSEVDEQFGFKLNLDSVVGLGGLSNDDIKEIISYGKPVFIDLKMSNGLRTMTNIVKRCVSLGVSVINVYATVGREYLEELVKITKGTNTKLFVLTVLTHYDDDYCNSIYYMRMKDTVKMFTDLAYDVGADGVILPPTVLEHVKDVPILKMCPGIRPKSSIKTDQNYQKQIAEPKEAIDAGATYLVVGSPIFKDDNICDNLREIIDEIDF